MNHVPRHHDVSAGYFTQEDCQRMNVAFARALLGARQRGLEKSFSLGPIVDHSPVDFRPQRFVGEHIWSGMGSSAAMCADLAYPDETGQRVGPTMAGVSK